MFLILSIVLGISAAAGFAVGIRSLIIYARMSGARFETTSNDGTISTLASEEIGDRKTASISRSKGKEMNVGFSLSIDDAKKGLAEHNPVIRAQLTALAGLCAGTLLTFTAIGAALLAGSIKEGWILIGIPVFFAALILLQIMKSGKK